MFNKVSVERRKRRSRSRNWRVFLRSTKETRIGEPLKTLFLICTVVSFLLPYTIEGWWKFFAAFLLIVIFESLRSGKKAWRALGLKMSPKSLVLSLLLLFCFWGIGRMVIFPIAARQGWVSTIESYGHHLYLLNFFQALNEEMLLRAMLLRWLQKAVKSQLLTSTFVALVFVSLHFVFYKFGAQQSSLNTVTLCTLFAFSLAMNQIFQFSDHIGYSAALHIGWNFTKLSETWVDVKTGREVGEVTNFNAIEGSWEVLFLSLILMGSVFALSRLHKALGRR